MTQELQVQSESDRQIAALKTPPEANILRNKIKAVQALAPKRLENFEVAFNGACSYCEVSAKAGKLWAELENKRPEGHLSTREISLVISVTDAGFGDSHDATVCARIGELTPEERKAYYHKCRNNDKIPSLGGLYAFWHVNNKVKTTPFPPGKYQVIYADPPWDVKAGPDWGSGGEHENSPYPTVIGGESAPLSYSTMNIEEMANLPVQNLADENAHLYLWTINKYICESYEIARAWDFKPVCLLTWAKPPHGIGLGGTFIQTTEHLLFCRRGTLEATKRIDRTWWEYPRGKHSEKPAEFRKMIEEVSPGNRIELFARTKTDGWDVWGNEI